jgi:transcriptional regulator of acetoin/glycerol metabolism
MPKTILLITDDPAVAGAIADALAPLGREATVVVLGESQDAAAAMARALEAVRHPEAGESPLSLADAERRQITRALEVHEGNRTHAARALGVSRATLIKKIKVYGLDV